MTASRRRERRKLDGVLLLDKPSGMSSNAALQAAKRLLNALKAGHTGTLDPLASGLLPLCFGEATKFAHALLDADKRYRAVLVLGVRTDTGDAEGTAIARRPVKVDSQRLAAAVARFVGDIDQLPPMYSALKRDGRPLYELARQGIEVERAPRRVRIGAIEVLAFAGERLELDVRCSKGTYIRSLADDLGEALGCGAHLAALRRTATGGFSLARAVTLEEIEALSAEERDARLLLPADALVADLPRIDLDAERSRLMLQGRSIAVSDGGESGRRRVYDDARRFLGLAELREDGLLYPLRLVASSER
jgi:tRNA pseudouridine55 synthase